MKRYLFLVICLFLSGSIFSQNINPSADEIYREDEVALIHLIMDPADKAFLLDDANIWYDEYHPAAFQFTNTLMDTTLVFDVGIRLRGNTSRSQPKRSFKLKFKEYDGEKFYGYKKFNLKAVNNDPAMLRELIAMQTFRKANVPATRLHHVEVYINEEYMGIYLNTEQIDDEFAKSRFDYDEGNLYKCTWPATLADDGQIYDNEPYELKTNEDINDRSVLANFVDVLNNTSDENFEEEIEKVFNVSSYIHYLAVEALSGHWDGYSYNKNNFYLYENNETGLIEFIPYDTDNTFGIDWVDRDWGTRDVLDWTRHGGDPRPLTSRILSREKYLYQYKNIIDSMLEEDFSETYFFPLFDNFKQMIASSISRDTYFPLTFGFTYTDFENSYTQPVADHVPYGLKPYVTTRTANARDQIGTVTSISSSEESYFEIYPNPSNGSGIILESSIIFSEISIKNTLGKTMDFNMKPIGPNKYSLDFHLNSGLYIIYLSDRSMKFIVN